MDTTRSEQMARAFLDRERPFQRKVQTYRRRFSARPEVVFAQLCPTREADWIDGWVADLIYSESGYAEPDCILTTPVSNVLGPGLWVITRREPHTLHEFVVIRPDGVVGHFTIELIDNGDGTSDSVWTLVFTATNDQGNAVITAMPEQDPRFRSVVLDALERYLQAGR